MSQGAFIFKRTFSNDAELIKNNAVPFKKSLYPTMATAPDSSDRIEDLLTCALCKETVKEPRTPGCFHSFRTKCLARYVET